MRAWVKTNGRLELRDDVAQPVPGSHDLLVRVEAISLNRGEVRAASLGHEGTIPGWDIAGTVEQTVPGGPPPGTRVAAMLAGGGWAEYACAPMHAAAVIPDEVSISIAATLPLAGLTVMRALAVGGSILGKRVLITGASGGVGSLAMQLAEFGGARVTSVSSVKGVSGEFDLILESVGGESFAAAVECVAGGGVIVTIGNSSELPATINPRSLYRKGGASIYGLLVFDEVDQRRVGSRELAYLLDLVKKKSIQPIVKVERSWRELDATLADLEHRKFRGKAVLRVD